MKRTPRRIAQTLTVLVLMTLTLGMASQCDMTPHSKAKYGVYMGGPPWYFDVEPIQPVPEPSTYGLIGAGALATLVAWRRFRS